MLVGEDSAGAHAAPRAFQTEVTAMTIRTTGQMPTHDEMTATIEQAQQMRALYIRSLALSLAARLRRRTAAPQGRTA